MSNTDILVLGSGIAGLTFAIKTAQRFPDLKINIITKADESESNTKYAQGGIAVVWDELSDSFDKHIADTLRAGDGLCNTSIVEMVVKDGPDRLAEIIEWGVAFDTDLKGKLDLSKEGGHTANRIIHYKDITGYQIEKGLLKKLKEYDNIQLLSHHYAIDLITEHHLHQKVKRPRPGITCYGAYVMDQNTGKIEKFTAKITLLATGGCGQVFKTTTNPVIASGDGVAMAYRAMAIVKDMEFIQFHPTAFYAQDENPAFLITEAMRGHGAQLKNRLGNRFVFKYDQRGEMASRDIVAKAIDAEMIESGEPCVYLDCTEIPNDELFANFPNIYERCKKRGIDITKEWIPVAPAAHYSCGGISVDMNGLSSIKNLYAAGECAHTGLHGANRLASNSLLEAVVFAHRCFLDVEKNIQQIQLPLSIPDWDAEGTVTPKELVLITQSRKELRELMSAYVAIVRSDERLHRALKRIDLLYHETEKLYAESTLSPQMCELRNLITVGYLICKQSLERKENRGVFYNVDLDEH